MISDEELHAFIDGELDQRRHAQVAECAARDADLSARVAAFRRDKALLVRAYDHIPDRPLPQAWLDAIEQGAKPRRARLSPRAWAAIAATLVAILSGTIAFRYVTSTRSDDIVSEALAARDERTTPRNQEPAGPGLSVHDRELSAALGMHLKAPDLARMGYHLAKLAFYDNVPGGHAVELDYRGSHDRRFTLYLRHSSSEPRFDQYEDNHLRICIWQDDVLGTVMAGSMSAAEMQRLASLAYVGLTS
jgi:anti-sigma factor RsiW